MLKTAHKNAINSQPIKKILILFCADKDEWFHQMASNDISRLPCIPDVNKELMTLREHTVPDADQAIWRKCLAQIWVASQPCNHEPVFRGPKWTCHICGRREALRAQHPGANLQINCLNEIWGHADGDLWETADGQLWETWWNYFQHPLEHVVRYTECL